MREKLNTNAQAVLEAVQAAEHPTALDVYETVKQTRPKIGLASVYRILHHLAERGYIKELGRNDDGCRYDARTSRHDHAICTKCGALIDIPIDVTLPEEALQAAAKAAGLQLTSHEVRLYGICPNCERTSKS
ncbi:Fur family ferric uptake transcriptional regulator/Fur family peroxide stress response transcriptional regulator [Thermosporothrix hazakensis]|jgi:Fe2+ or Zn2+ uptake regulation protein|uniref:Fur family ferric uptake transcriptional regulator/Fur family peroxide stress response transcriptional regulator n=1 Tax=Thermosporothrix hazakensis TaxID=644383 RepID=A0A326TX84_THEHA|nr:transcriptional repressor [Thermosporothrix hazakensis]PZW21000.1 Fur family ferric uptake transcriptional regulator/Fur family peroxide stress response transcriptional regulator [Thermosporothrix hazakensis]GCE49283.1 transcriptional repressor [Thermosporothrix hazakensis]